MANDFNKYTDDNYKSGDNKSANQASNSSQPQRPQTPPSSNYSTQNRPQTPNSSGPSSPNNPFSQGQRPQKEETNAEKIKRLEEERLRKLTEQLSRPIDDEDDKKGAVWSGFKRFLWVLLVLVVIGSIGGVVFFIIRNAKRTPDAALIRLSMDVDENVSDMTPEDQVISKKQIFPGDKFAVECSIRNSDDINGDDADTQTPDVYVRFKIELEIGKEKYTGILLPTLNDYSWHIYDASKEGDDYEWDGYYYYYGKLIKNQSLTLFSELTFDFMKTVNSFGGKQANVKVTVEVVEADVDNIGEKAAWSTAPPKWLQNMKDGVNNYGVSIDV